jgi:hypothetical protein
MCMYIHVYMYTYIHVHIHIRIAYIHSVYALASGSAALSSPATDPLPLSLLSPLGDIRQG